MISGGIDVDAEHRDMLRNGLPSIIHIQGHASDSRKLVQLVESLAKEINPSADQGINPSAQRLGT